MSRFAAKESVRGRAKALAEQFTDLAEKHDQLVQAVDGVLSRHDSRISASEELLMAVVETIGEETVKEAVYKRQKANAERKIEENQKALEQAIADGWAVADITVGEDSYMVGTETNAEGQLAGFGAQYCAFAQLPEQWKPLLIGKTVGDTVATPTGGTFSLTGVYKLDPAKRKELIEAKIKEAEAAANQGAPTESPASAEDKPAE